MDPATTTTEAPVTPRKRKPRAAKPPVERKPRKAALTLERRVAQMSPTHAEALRVLSKADATFKTELRDEMERTEAARRAVARWERASDEVKEADLAMKPLVALAMKPSPRRTALDGLAHDIARRTGLLDVEPEDVNAAPASDPAR